MNRFEFATAGRIVFGGGTLAEVAPAARSFSPRALVVTGRTPARAGRLLELLAQAKVATTTFTVAREPTIADALAGAQCAIAADAGLVIGFGGGAALDAAKAIAPFATNRGDPLDYLEVIGRAQPLTVASLPCIAIPTTAGTGAEVTRNAVLASPEHRVKVSLRSPQMLPRLALVDPELARDLPPGVTASTGLDALTQLIEPFVSSRANPFTDALCRDGILLAARSLRRAVEHGADLAAREDLALASLYGGLALANAGLGAVHGFAGPIGGMFPAPHGAVCAALLPHAMEANVQALQTRASNHPARQRYDEVARLLTGHPHAIADEGVRWVSALIRDVRIPPLRTYGMTEADFPEVVGAAAKASSMKANPLPLTPAELKTILRAAL